MKKSLFLLLFLCTLFSFAQTDTTLNKMRAVRIAKGNKIILQSDIERLKDISVKARKENYYLKKGNFSGTDSINIEVNEKNQIVAVSFFYDTVSTYQYEVDLFNKHLGFVGAEFKNTSKKEAMKVTKWEDARTVFEMVEVTVNGKWKLYSTIFDKELYYKKVKPRMNLEKYQDSISLLKCLGKI